MATIIKSIFMTVLLLTLNVLFASDHHKLLLHSFKTVKKGKQTLGLIINVADLHECSKGVGILKTKITNWKKKRLTEPRHSKNDIVLLTVVIRKKHMQDCKERATNLYLQDRQFKSILENLEFQITIIENRET